MLAQQSHILPSLISDLCKYLKSQEEKKTKYTKNETIIVNLITDKGAILSCEAKEALKAMNAKSVQYCLNKMVEKNIIKRRTIDISKVSHKSKSIYFIEQEHADRLEVYLEKNYGRRTPFNVYK